MLKYNEYKDDNHYSNNNSGCPKMTSQHCFTH